MNESPSAIPSSKFLDNAFCAMLLASVVFCLSRTLPDFDLWGHLKYGLDFIAHKEILQVDPYSYVTAGTRWVDHEWLWEILLGAFYQVMGVAGISAVRLITVAGVFAILIWRLHIHKVPALLTGLIVIGATLLCTPGLSPSRPQNFTYLFFAIQLAILEWSATKRAALLLLPVLFVLWANIHGGFLAGLATLFIWSGVRFVFTRDIMWIGISLLCLGASCITPYGHELLMFLLKTATVPRPEISEWHPLTVTSLQGIIYVLSLPVVLILLLREVKERPHAMATLYACLMLPFMAHRHLPVATIAAIILLAKAMGEAMLAHPAITRQLTLAKGTKIDNVLVGICAITAVGMLVFAAPRTTAIMVSDDIPKKAVNILKQSEVTGNMACYFDWGEYSIWHLFPKIKVSMDGRRETSYNEVVYQENLQFTYGVGDWSKLLQRQTNIGLTSKSTASYALMALLPDWKIVYEDSVCAIFARKDFAGLQRLEQAALQWANKEPESKFP